MGLKAAANMSIKRQLKGRRGCCLTRRDFVLASTSIAGSLTLGGCWPAPSDEALAETKADLKEAWEAARSYLAEKYGEGEVTKAAAAYSTPSWFTSKTYTGHWGFEATVSGKQTTVEGRPSEGTASFADNLQLPDISKAFEDYLAASLDLSSFSKKTFLAGTPCYYTVEGINVSRQRFANGLFDSDLFSPAWGDPWLCEATLITENEALDVRSILNSLPDIFPLSKAKQTSFLVTAESKSTVSIFGKKSKPAFTYTWSISEGSISETYESKELSFEYDEEEGGTDRKSVV